MSTTVDSKVVEMRFDNQHFENNVSTTMSTLDKLKQKLHLDGASKGLENINAAAKNVNMSGIGSAVETVQAKFSAMEVIGVTALANITNSAVNAGKRIVSALTIDPVRSGFQEYEMKMDSIKTIVNSTGRDLEDVNRLLEELNEYSDQTIYSFRDMTQNIGKFTNAGVGLEDAVLAIKGISNEAAVSGANANEASRAMYNFSQALSAGFVKLIDWKSIENANMATKEFKQQLIDTAVEVGTLVEGADGMYNVVNVVSKANASALNATKNFNDSLGNQWMTTDVLIKTLGKYADVNTEIGKKAFAAAQEVTKLTQMWDVLKETAQSGWAKTWELIVGDLNSAKAIFTPLTNFFSGMIDTMSDARNRVLEIALHFSTPWDAIMDKIGNIKKAIAPVKEFADKLAYFQDVVDRVWMGEFNNWGDDPDRRDLLSQAGYDHRVVQELVNLGEESWHAGKRYKLSVEEVEAAHKKFGLTMETTKEETKEVVTAVNELSDEQLKNAGLTEEEIALYRALEKEAARAGISVSELADEMSKNKGRDMLIDSFKNIGGAVVDMGKAIKSAWINIFNPPGAEVLGIRLYGAIRSLKSFTESLRLTDKTTGELNETGLKFQSIFKGIFAAVDIVVTILGGPLKLVFQAAKALLKYLGIGILDVAAFVGDAIVAFRDWIDSVFDFTKIFEKIVPPITNAIDAFREWIRSLKDSENLPRDIAVGIVSFFDGIIDAVVNFVKKIPGYLKKIPELFANGFDLAGALGDSPLASFIGKIANGFGVAGQVIVEIGKILLDRIRGFLSRSEFMGISGNAIAGLVNGFKDGAVNAWNAAVEMVTNLVQRVKDFLGIHSPSKVFYAIGGFIIAGLIAGLQNGIPDSLGAIKSVFQPMLDWIKGIDFGAVLAGAMGIGTVIAANKAAGALAAIAEPFRGLGDILENASDILKSLKKPIQKVVKGFANLMNSVALNLKADAIKTLAISLLLLVGAIVVLTFLDIGKMWNAVGVIAALAVILVGLTFAIDKINKSSATIDKNGINISGLSSGLFGIGVAVLLLALTVKTIGSLNRDQAIQGFLGLAGIIAAIVIVVAAFGKLVKGKAAENIDKFGKTMTKLAIALLLMTLVIKVLGRMDSSTLHQGAIAMTTFIGILIGVMAATKLISGSKNVEKIGGTLLKMALAIGIMTLVVKMLGSMDRGILVQGTKMLVLFGGMLVGLMAATKLINGSKNVDVIGGTLLKIAVAIGIMALVAKLLGGMNPAELIQGTIGIGLFGGMIVGLMAATKLITGSKNVDKIGTSLLAISGAIAIMALTAFMLSMISWEGFAKGTIMITAFSAIIVGLMAATKLINGSKNVATIGKTLMSVAGAIGILALIAVLLGMVSVENLVKGVVAVGVLSLIMAGLIAVTKFSKDCVGTVIAIAGAIAIIGGVVYLLSTLPVESVTESAIALGSLMAVMTGVLATTAFIGKSAKDALKGVLLLTAMAVPLLAFYAVLMLMQGVENAVTNATALATLAAVMALAMVPLTICGTFAAQALIGVLALTAMAVPLLAFVGALAIMQGIQNAADNSQILISLMTTITDILVKLSIVAPLALVAVAAVTGLIALMTVFGLLVTAIGALVTQFPQIETFIDTGIPLLEKLAAGIGSMIGKFVGGIMEGIAESLPSIGANLSAFMNNAMPFINGAKLVDDSVVTGVGCLAKAVLVLTAAELISGIASFVSGGVSLSQLGADLSAFMINATPFIMGASMINPEVLDGVKSLAQAMLVLTAANVVDGLTSWFAGEASLADFGAELAAFAPYMVEYANTVSGIDTAAVEASANAAKALSEVAANLPNSGGVVSWFTGENDMSTFGTQLVVFGQSLKEYSDAVFGIDTESVKASADAGKALSEMASAIPNLGGMVTWFTGDNDIATFGEKLASFGRSLKQYANAVVGIDVEAINVSVTAGKALSEMASSIPDLGGMVTWFTGDNDIATFGEKVASFGASLLDYSNKVKGIDAEAVNVSVNAAKNLSSMASSIPDLGGMVTWFTGDNDLATFGNQLVLFGTSMKNYGNAVAGIDIDAMNASVNAAKALAQLQGTLDNSGGMVSWFTGDNDLGSFGNNILNFGRAMADYGAEVGSINTTQMSRATSEFNKVANMIRDMAGVDFSGLSSFGNALGDIGKSGIDAFIETFTNSSTRVSDAAAKMIENAAKGAKAKTSVVRSAFVKVINDSIEAIRNRYHRFYGAGSYLVEGFAAGISENDYKAEAKARAMAKAAAKAAEDELAINSPSKVFRKIGTSIPEGFAMGIDKLNYLVTGSSVNMANSALDNVKTSIARISDMVSTDIDTQPTIRPVLDLSDVKSGASALSGMLNMDSSVGVRANIGAISSMMSLRGQNGSNADVVSAINKLNKKMDNLGNTTYQVNGVTYDDGSNISDAVRTLVRAARIEGRV